MPADEGIAVEFGVTAGTATGNDAVVCTGSGSGSGVAAAGVGAGVGAGVAGGVGGAVGTGVAEGTGVGLGVGNRMGGVPVSERAGAAAATGMGDGAP